ncbi:MAG: amino acid permease [Ruminococcaceae bacterium]|nr:amino acid permease [Oscillospiraceae bacterium]
MERNNNSGGSGASGLTRHLSTLEVWALSIGCAVGWGAFVMPGTTFLPIAGPAGTALGMAIGALVMLVIGVNYHFLMNKYPDAGGTLTYSIRAFGFDHGLLSAWFLMLVYIAIMWANATAVVLIVRSLSGSLLQWGLHYQVAGYHVYLGEVLLTLAVILGFGFVCLKSKRLAIVVQTVMAIILVCGIVVCAAAVLSKGGFRLSPAFAPVKTSRFGQIMGIVVLAPWAFVGFESISNSTQDFRFSPKRAIWIMAAALVAGALCYILLNCIAAAVQPEGFDSWTDYIAQLGTQDGLAALPTFYAVNAVLGKTGLAILGVAVTCGIVTGLVGNYIAASRLIYAMTKDGFLPAWFGKLDHNGNPVNAFKVLMAISVLVPFAGRAAIGWIVDVNTIGALIAYTYTSAAACKTAKLDGNTPVRITGFAGAALSLLFFLYFMVPNLWTVSALSAESYLILIVWSVIGFLFFRYVFREDTQDRFGKSTAVWITLLFLIFFTSVLWFRQSTINSTERVLSDLNRYNIEEMESHGVTLDETDAADAAHYIEQKMDEVNRDMVRNSLMQMTTIVVALTIMLSIYKSMTQREKRMEAKKIKAEESSRAKSTFLSNMTHDIRTPMNAIIGYTTLAKRLDGLPPEAADYLNKIEASGQHLLALINDVLDMSRIENGKMELEPERTDLKQLIDGVRDLFAMQMETKGIFFTVNAENIQDRMVLCDANRLNRMLLNLISNACKFTPQGGSVSVTLRQKGATEDEGFYELRVRDTGMGMSPEFAETVFEAYSREKTASGIQGTGLGMAITKNIVDLMGGMIEVKSEKGKGSEFLLRLRFPLAGEAPAETEDHSITAEPDFTGIKLLLVDDNEINREIAMLLLEEAGFILDTAENGKEAVDKVAARGGYQAVLMDIQMPAMNGYDAARAIRSLPDPALSSIPIIAMTANAFAEDIRVAESVGMNGHIAKPIDLTKMMAELTRVLSRRE